LHDDQSEDMLNVVGSWWRKHPWDLLWPEGDLLWPEEKREEDVEGDVVMRSRRRGVRSTEAFRSVRMFRPWVLGRDYRGKVLYIGHRRTSSLVRHEEVEERKDRGTVVSKVHVERIAG
jgi:hypothetical protein